MPFRPRQLRNRRDELSPRDVMELSIGGPNAQLEAMWRRHGAQLMRDDMEGRRFSWPLECYGPPPGWTAQDEREHAARRAATEADRERNRRRCQEFHIDEETE